MNLKKLDRISDALPGEFNLNVINTGPVNPEQLPPNKVLNLPVQTYDALTKAVESEMARQAEKEGFVTPEDYRNNFLNKASRSVITDIEPFTDEEKNSMQSTLIWSIEPIEFDSNDSIYYVDYWVSK